MSSHHDEGSYGSFKFGARKCGDRDYSPPATPTPTPVPTPPPTTTTPSPTIPTPTPTPATPPAPPAGSSGSDTVLSALPSLAITPDVDVRPFTAKSLGYGEITLDWRAPTAPSALRLVRNASGYPVDENDGVLLYEGQPPFAAHFYDSRLNLADPEPPLEGREYYYTIFIRLPYANEVMPSTATLPDASVPPSGGATGWVPAASTRAVAVRDTDAGNSGNLLTRYLPRVLTTVDQDAVGEITEGTQLDRFLQVFAFQVDAMKTSIENLMPFHEAATVQGPMVGPLARMLGQNLENGLGVRQTRILARDATYIYKHKGSRLGINAFAKALTGLGAKTLPGYNIMADTVDSSFSNAKLGRWSAASNCTLGSTVNSANITAAPTPTTPAILLPGGLSVVNGAAMMITAAASGAMSARHAGTAATGWGIAVEGGATYGVSASIQTSSTSRTVTLAVEWRDSSGGLIATSTQSPGTSDSTTYARASYIVVAPANAFFANVLVSWAGCAANEVHFLDGIQFEKLSITIGDGDVELDPSVNPWTLVAPPAPVQNLCTNPTFETNTTGWLSPAGYDTTTLATSSTFAHAGTKSLKATWNSSAAGTGGVAYQATNLNPGQRYQLSLWAYVPSGNPRVAIAEMTGAGNNFLYATRDTGTTKDAWVQLSVAFRAAGTMLLGVQLDEQSTLGQVAYIDDVSLVNLDYPYSHQMSVDSTVHLGGKQSLKLQGFNSGDDAYAYQTVPVVPGQAYNVTASANVPLFTGGALGTRGLYVTDGAQTSNAGTPGTSATYTKVFPPTSGAYSGFYTPTNDIFKTIQQESTYATTWDIVPFYVDFSNLAGTDSASWPTANMKAVYDGGSVSSTSGSGTITGGRIPLIRWESAIYSTQAAGMPTPASVTYSAVAQKAVTYAQIVGSTAGQTLYQYIQDRADAVKAWGKPIMISFDHEVDTFNLINSQTSARRLAAVGITGTAKGAWAGATTAYSANDLVTSGGSVWRALTTITASATNPAPSEGASWTQVVSSQYDDAFRFIKAIFEARGVTNVTWVYSLSGQSGSNISATALNDTDYDWIGVDPYIKTTASTVASRLQSYVTRLDNGEAGTGGQTKPIIFCEWGVDSTYGNRTQAFAQLVTALNTGNLRRVKALCYNNSGVDQLSTSGATATTGLIVPAFYDPYQNDSWERMIRNPQGISWIIANDSNGRMADRHADPAYPQAIARARAAGIKIMYYVETHRAQKSLADVKADMDGWRRCYGQPDGWFFDQASTHASDISYYQALYTYGGGGAGGKTIMINPGDTPDQAYMTGTGIFDIIGVAEDTSYEVNNWPWPTWQNSYDRSRMAVFTYRSRNVTADWNYISSHNIGWAYVGDDNVFNALPAAPFFSTEQNLAASSVSDTNGFTSLVSSSYLNIAGATVASVTTQTSPAVVGQYTTITGPSSGWTQHLVTITPLTSKLQIRLYSPNATVYWDNIGMARNTVAPFSDARRQDVLLFADRVNYVTNPSFESGATTGWSVTPTAPATTMTGYSGSTTLSADTTYYYGGTTSLKVTHPTTTKSGATTMLTDLTPGQVYTVSARVLVPPGSPTVAIEHDAAGFIASGASALSINRSTTVGTNSRSLALTISESTNVVEGVYPELPGIFTRIYTQFVATANVHTVGFYATGTTAGNVFYLDQVMAEASAVVNDYFDGAVLGVDYMWEGTANLSRSHYIRNLNTRSKRLAARLPAYLPAGVPYAVRLAWPGS